MSTGAYQMNNINNGRLAGLSLDVFSNDNIRNECQRHHRLSAPAKAQNYPKISREPSENRIPYR